MKYGESTFDILYLLFAIVVGILLLRRSRGPVGRKMGLAALILGCGDAFHLIPRVLNYFVAADWTAALGVGKFVTSVTMTVFYVILYRIWLEQYGRPEDRRVSLAVYILAGVRVLLCLFPQNGWLTNDSSLLWGVLRNAPFVALGVLLIVLWYRTRSETPALRRVWLYMTLSFLFYIPVATVVGLLPILGMLMLPKTVCYICILVAFYKFACPRER